MPWRFDRYLYKREMSFWMKVLLLPLHLLSFSYGWAVRLRIFSYRVGLIKSKQLSCPVISVGNITVGGTGKTPLVMALAKVLGERGVPIAILSRGYKGRKASEAVVSDGQKILLTPEESGDEPQLMARSLRGVPILIGRDRFEAGQIALKRFGIRGFLLDDGYQHLQLHRDLDILLVDSQIGFGNGHLLPRGILREPISNLRRAHLFLITKVEDPRTCQPLRAKLHEIHPQAEIYHSHYEPLGLIGPEGQWDVVHVLKGKKALAFSGVGNPGYFTSLLKKCGMEVVKEEIFPDHYSYTARDLTFIGETVNKIDYLVTTEKDFIKLLRMDMGHLPIRALRIEMRVREEEEFYKRIMSLW